jgi:hypothetical protein
MKHKLVVLVALLSLVIPTRLFAKGAITKITIEGADLKAPIEISDFRDFKGVGYSPWAGPGVSDYRGAQTEGFIIDDWSQPVTERPKGLRRYKVSFYAKFPDEKDEKLVYVVLYEYDPAAGRGYIYLPGRGDDSYWLNMGTIARGVEGHWYRARTAWDSVARPLIAGAKVTSSSTGLD